MENKYDALREKGVLVLLTISPMVIGFLYAILIGIPLVGTVWQYASPFILLYFWGWVATVFQDKTKSLIKTVGYMNIVGVLSLILYIWQVNASSSMQNASLLFLSQLFTMPLSFLTMWVGLVIEGGTDFETLSAFTAILSIFLGTILLIITSVIGFFVGKSMEERAIKKKEEERQREQEEVVESVFSDRRAEEDGLNPPQ